MAAGWRHFTGVSQYPELAHNSDFSSVAYGPKMDRSYRINWLQGERDFAMETRLMQWMKRVINVGKTSTSSTSTSSSSSSSNEQDMAEWLQDGVVLCQLLNALSPRMITKIHTRQSKFTTSENITAFLNGAKHFGLSKDELFELGDLLDQRNIARVIKTIKALYDRSDGDRERERHQNDQGFIRQSGGDRERERHRY